MAGGAVTLKDLLPGATVDYFSSAKQSWLPVRVTKVDPETGSIEVDLRPGQSMGKEEQAKKLRRHLKPAQAQLEWVRSVMGTDSYAAELADFFSRHAETRTGGGEPVVRWSALSRLAADLDVQLGVCGSIVLLEQEASPLPKRCEPSAAEAFTAASFGCAFWKLLHGTLRDYGHALPSKRVAPRRGEQCGAEYEVERELKRGTYGQVRLVRERRTGARLAVKAISKAFMAGAEDMLQLEVEHLCRVDHPNIVKLHKHYEDAENVYLVMDFCSGGDLQDRLSRAATPLAEGFVAHVMRQLMRAVAHVHARGIVHLDIKGLNIMLTHRSSTILPVAGSASPALDHDWPHVMLIDLGVAQLFRPGDYQRSFPGGTPATMAPDIWRGVITPAADVFSCGIVFWELSTLQLDPIGLVLTGSLEDFIRQAQKFWEAGPQLRWEYWSRMPEAACKLCRGMLQKDRRDRPSAQACLSGGFLGVASAGGPLLDCSEPKVVELVGHLAHAPRRSILYKSVALSIARKWPANQLPTVQKAFHALDTARMGCLGLDAVTTALREFGMGKSDACAAAKSMDLNRDGLIDWTEFVAACTRLSDPAFENTLLGKFQKADASGGGLLCQRDLATLIPGHSPDDTEIGELFKALNKRGGAAGLDWQDFRGHFQGQDAAASTATIAIRACDKPSFGDAVFQMRRPGPFDDPNLRTAMLSL